MLLAAAGTAPLPGQVINDLGGNEQALPAPPPATQTAAVPTPDELADIPVSAELRSLVTALDAADYAARTAATKALLAGPFDRLQLYAVLAREALSAEQRHRVLGVLQQRIQERPRGALGIQMRRVLNNAGAGERGVEIRGLLAGMPAEQVMRVGDIIVAIEGEPVHDASDLQVLVQSRRPGETVRLDVKRPQRDRAGELLRDEHGARIYNEVQVDLELGSTEQLRAFDNGRAPQPDPLQVRRRQEVDEAMKLYGATPRALPVRTARSAPGPESARR